MGLGLKVGLREAPQIPVQRHPARRILLWPAGKPDSIAEREGVIRRKRRDPTEDLGLRCAPQVRRAAIQGRNAHELRDRQAQRGLRWGMRHLGDRGLWGAAWREVPICGTLAARHEMVYNHSMEFEWAREKAKRNLKKHGVSFGEAATVFYDPLSATFTDPEHALGELSASLLDLRFITIGHSSRSLAACLAHGPACCHTHHKRATSNRSREKTA